MPQEEQEYITIEEAAEKVGQYWSKCCDEKYELTSHAIDTICYFLSEIGNISEILDAIDTATEKIEDDRIEERYKYFCGVCWNKIKSKACVHKKVKEGGENE